MDSVPRGPALILVQRWEPRNRKILRKRKKQTKRGGWVETKGGAKCEGGKVASEHLPMVETLTDGLGSLSNSPRRESSRSSYTQSWDQHPHTHTHAHTHTQTHTVGRTEDETTLCQHGTVPAMLMRFIWIRVGLYRRKKEGWNGQREAKTGNTDWRTTYKWRLPCSVHNWEATTVKPQRYSLD